MAKRKTKPLPFDIPTEMFNKDGEIVSLTPLERKVLLEIRKSMMFDEKYYPESESPSYGGTFHDYIVGSVEGLSDNGMAGVLGSLNKKKIIHSYGFESAKKAHSNVPQESEHYSLVDIGGEIWYDEKKNDYVTVIDGKRVYEKELSSYKEPKKSSKKSSSGVKSNSRIKTLREDKDGSWYEVNESKSKKSKSVSGKFKSELDVDGKSLRILSQQLYTDKEAEKIMKEHKSAGKKCVRGRRSGGWIIYHE